MMDEEEESRRQAITEALMCMPGMSRNVISVKDFLEALETFGYMVLSQQEYDDATDPRMYEPRD